MELKHLLEKNDVDFCIIGNSPKEMGKGNGKKIDSHKLVLRFNDFSTSPDFYKDYGSRTSVWIRGSNDKNIYTMEEKKKHIRNFDLTVMRAKRDWSNDFRAYMKANKLPLFIFPINYEIELSRKLKFSPSTGLLTLYYIRKNFGKIDRDRIYGFSFCKENRDKAADGGQIHYYNRGDLINPNSNKKEKIKKTFLVSRHLWHREEEFFKKELIL
tara:strand:+ start:47 stop:685 length:639 start_codon:yes stop_codon:yes gene_type:complete